MDTALERALKLLSKQEYSQAKLREKLAGIGVDETELDQCVQRLIGWGYLDDRKYGSFRIELLQKRLKSQKYVRMDLLEKGLNQALVEELVETLYPIEEEFVIAEKLLKKRNRYHQKASAEWNFLIRSGFAEDIVVSCLAHLSPT